MGKKTGIDEVTAMHLARTSLERAAHDYEEACRAYHQLWLGCWPVDEAVDHYINRARSCASQWSGGHTVSNLCEQIERTVCLTLADKALLGLAQR